MDIRRAFVCLGMVVTSACGGTANELEGAEGSETRSDWQVAELELCQRDVEPFDVTFQKCSEFVGVTLVPTSNVRSRVPADYELAVYTTPEEAAVVVRIADCDAVRVRNKKPRAARVVQVGVVLAGMNSGSDIDNYTLWYVTNDQHLARELSNVGVPAEFSKQSSYSFSPNASGSGPLTITSRTKHAPDFLVSGAAALPTTDAIPFQASWWYDGVYGTIQMETYLPVFQFGVAATQLTTQDTTLRALFGAYPVTFSGLDSYNTFAAAYMQVFAP
jgi:hypothetical protein